MIHSPLDALLNPSTEAETNQIDAVKSTVASTLVVVVLAASLLWRDRKFSKGLSTLVPAVVAAAIVISVLIASMVIMAIPAEKDKTDNLVNYGASETYDYNDFGSSSTFQSDAATAADANTVLKKAEVYNANEGSYPQTPEDFAKSENSDLGDISLYDGPVETLLSGEILYVKCADNDGAQVIYKDDSDDIKILAMGGASSTKACS